MQNIPKWAEPKVQEYNTNQGPPEHVCESICNPTNSGEAGKYCGCYESPQEIPISGGYKLSK